MAIYRLTLGIEIDALDHANVQKTIDEIIDAVNAIAYVSETKVKYPDEPSGTKERLEYLRSQIRAERISYGEIAELQSLTPYIEPGDVELAEWAGIPENPCS